MVHPWKGDQEDQKTDYENLCLEYDKFGKHLGLFGCFGQNFTDNAASSGSVTREDSKGEGTFLHCLQFWAFIKPIAFLMDFGGIGKMKFSNRYVLAGQTDLINKHLTSNHNRITRNLFRRFIDISGDNLSIININKIAIPQNFNFELFLCSLFYLFVWNQKEDVVDGGCCKTEEE